jgi:hypothetical protein
MNSFFPEVAPGTSSMLILPPQVIRGLKQHLPAPQIPTDAFHAGFLLGVNFVVNMLETGWDGNQSV